MVKIGLAPCRFVNGDVAFNLSQMESAMKAQRGRVDLLCFGEAFLQGFDALCWDYEIDRKTAVSAGSDVMKRLADRTAEYGVDLLFGYLESWQEGIYSSCAVLERPAAHGGAFFFRDGKAAARTPFDAQEVLIVQI